MKILYKKLNYKKYMFLNFFKIFSKKKKLKKMSNLN